MNEKENEIKQEGLVEERYEQESQVPAIDLQKEIEKLKSLLDEKTRESEENYKRFLLASADLENYKKRVEREKIELVDFANEKLIKELIIVLDSIEKAVEHINTNADFNALRDGVKLTMDQFLSVLKKFGLEQISAMGDKFDPSKHEAITHEESGGYPPDTVIKEFHKGYYLKNRLLRPAMVAVSKSHEDKVQ